MIMTKNIWNRNSNRKLKIEIWTIEIPIMTVVVRAIYMKITKIIHKFS